MFLDLPNGGGSGSPHLPPQDEEPHWIYSAVIPIAFLLGFGVWVLGIWKLLELFGIL